MLVQLEGCFEVVEDLLGELRCFVRLLDVGLDQGELVAAQPRQGTEVRAAGAQAVGEGDQQLVAELVAVLLVDALEIVQTHAQYRHAMLQAAAVDKNLVQLLLQLLAVGQTGEEVVLGHALQAVFRLVAQVGVALDRGQQLVGGVHPQAQLVLLVAFEQR